MIRCPACRSNDSRIVKSQPKPNRIRHTRQCGCGHRFGTVEIIAPLRMALDMRRIRRMIGDGKKISEVASILGVSYHAIWQRLNQ